ncbi:MAG: MSMEG_4193 family putative phosphomutase [Actinomycetota bacterium]
MTVFVFVRHAVTNHTGKRLSGWAPDVHLSPAGRKQAEAAAEALASLPLKAVYSSPIDRAVETARPIAARHGLRVRLRDRIGEVGYGDWTDKPLKSLVRTKLWAQVQRWPSAARFPNGESLREVQARAVGEIERMRAAHPEQAVCCVTHADVIKLITAHFLGLHLDLFQRMAIGPASITAIAIQDEGPMLLTLNQPPNGTITLR